MPVILCNGLCVVYNIPKMHAWGLCAELWKSGHYVYIFSEQFALVRIVPWIIL